MEIKEFKEVAKQYKVVFFDAYGVLKKHDGIIKGVKETLNWLIEEGIDFYVITNDASRSPELLSKAYYDGGIDIIQPNNLVSSAMLCMEFFKENIHPGSQVAYLGGKLCEHFIKEADLIPIRIENITNKDYPNIEAVALFGENVDDLHFCINKALNLIRGTDSPVIVANPDLIYPVSDEESAITVGSIANMLEAVSNRKFFRFGKPNINIFEYALEKINQQHKYSKREILMVGDTLETDIIGGNKFGIDTALVLSGSTIPLQAEKMIKEKGICPTYVCNSITDLKP